MFQNAEASSKKMQQRIMNREEQIRNLEDSLSEFQQTHRRTVEELSDRLQLYEAQLKALAISDAPPMSRARLVKSIRGRVSFGPMCAVCASFEVAKSVVNIKNCLFYRLATFVGRGYY